MWVEHMQMSQTLDIKGYFKETFKSVLYIQTMHLIMPYISLGHRLH